MTRVCDLERKKRSEDKEKREKDKPASTSRKLEQSKVVESDVGDEGFSRPRHEFPESEEEQEEEDGSRTLLLKSGSESGGQGI